MHEGITVNGVHTYYDLGLCIAERNITPPSIRTIRKSVPFRHGSYDFTSIGGEPIYDDTTAEYVFSIAEFEAKDMETEKSKIQSFFAGLQDVDFTDDFCPGYTYHGSYITPNWSEDFGRAEFGVKIAIDPFKVGDDVGQIISGTADIVNDSDCIVTPSSIAVTSDTTLTIGGTSYSVKKGSATNIGIVFKPGRTSVTVGTGSATFRMPKIKLV